MASEVLDYYLSQCKPLFDVQKLYSSFHIFLLLLTSIAENVSPEDNLREAILLWPGPNTFLMVVHHPDCA